MPNWLTHIDQSNEPAYAGIAAAIHADIAAGILKPGQRLPTHRELADQLGVARGTVMRAYREAERNGLIRSRVGSGTYVLAPDPFPQPHTAPAPPPDSGIIDLSANRPLQHLDPDLSALLSDLAREGNRGPLASILRYSPIEGRTEHRRIGAEWLHSWGLRSEPADIQLCGGAQHAIYTALASIAKPDDSVATEWLTYPSIKAIAHTLGVRLIPVRMDELGAVPESLEAIAAARRLVGFYTIPTLHNPTGTTLPEDRRRKIAEIAARHDFAIIEDDIHRLYHPDPPPPIAAFAPERTIFIASTSKCVAGGLRIAFVHAPESLRHALRERVMVSLWNVPPLMAEITTRLIRSGLAAETTARKRAEMRSRIELARCTLTTLSAVQADGLSIWITPPEGSTSAEIALDTQRQGVLVSHDAVFAVGDLAPQGLRVSLSAPERHDTLSTALRTLDRSLHPAKSLRHERVF